MGNLVLTRSLLIQQARVIEAKSTLFSCISLLSACSIAFIAEMYDRTVDDCFWFSIRYPVNSII